jgi:hypothetical protein
MSVEMRDIQALERELSSLPAYRAPDELRRSLRARLVSDAAQRTQAPIWLGIALWRTAALAAATVLLLSGLGWAIVASVPGDPLYAVKDAITRLVGAPRDDVRPVPAGGDGPVTRPTVAPARMLAPPSIVPAEATERAGGPTATDQPAVKPVAPTTPEEPATAEPSSPTQATPAVPPSPPGPRATPAVPPQR